jgi:uncharacterized protein YbjQ (UPF0145 family)
MSTKKKNDKTDLTRLEDLSKYDHPEDGSSSDETRELQIDSDELTVGEKASEDENYNHEEMIEGILQGADFLEKSIDQKEISPEEENAIDELSLGDDTPLSIGSEELSSETEEIDELSTSTDEPERTEKTEEIFEDVKTEFENSWPMHIPQESLPSFSVKIGNINSEQDKEDLELILQELKILTDDNRELILKSIARGEALIPRIGEYLAIYLAHKVRKFNFDLSLGLSEHIHPSKYDDDQIAYSAVTNKSHRLNRQDTADLRHQSLTPDDILLSTFNQIDGHRIVANQGIAVETKIVSTKNLLDESNLIQFKDSLDQVIQVEKPELKLTYQNLANQLRVQAIKQKGNAILGLNFHLTPLVSADESSQNYQITCTGNVVWLEKK